MNPLAFVLSRKRSNLGIVISVGLFMLACVLIGGAVMKSPFGTTEAKGSRTFPGRPPATLPRPIAGSQEASGCGERLDSTWLGDSKRDPSRDIRTVLAWGRKRATAKLEAASDVISPQKLSPRGPANAEKELETEGREWAEVRVRSLPRSEKQDSKLNKWAIGDRKKPVAKPESASSGQAPVDTEKSVTIAFGGQKAQAEAMARFMAEAKRLQEQGKRWQEQVKKGDQPAQRRSGGKKKTGSTAAKRPADVKPPAHSIQKIIKNAELHIEVESFAQAGLKINSLVAQHRGFYADCRITRNENGTTGGYYVIRVPQAGFEALYAALKSIGTIKLENAKGQDVTSNYVDLQARIRNAEHMEARLLAMLEDKKRRNNKMSEILEIERALGAKRRDVEALRGRMRVIKDSVELGTVHLTISEPGRSVPQGAIAVETRDLDAQDRALSSLATKLGGGVTARISSKRPDGTGVVKATVKVPMTGFGDMVEAVKALGRVVSEEISGYNPVAISKDPSARKIVGSLRVQLSEPASQKPGGTVFIEVKSLSAAASSIGNILDNLGGSLVSRNETRRGTTASAHYVVRTPRAKFAELIASLNAVGRIENKQLAGVDVIKVSGPAAELPCDLSLNLFERSRQMPTASAAVSTSDLAAASASIAALLKTVSGHVVSHHEHRTPGGAASANYVLRCRRKTFAAMIGGLETIGRIAAKDVQGLDLEEVTGAAADTLCSLSLKVEERRAPKPGAVLEVETGDAGKASKALRALRSKHKVETVSVKRTRTLTGTLELWKLHVPVAAFDDFVSGVEELGEVKKRQVEGSSASAQDAPDPKALAKVAVTIREVRAALPSATLELLTLDNEAASTRVRELARKAKADVKDHKRRRDANGAPVEYWTLRVPVRQFDDFVEKIIDLGEIKRREVQGVSPNGTEQPDAKAMADVSLILHEKRAAVPTADLQIEVSDVREACKTLKQLREKTKAEVEERRRLKALDGTAVEHWVLLIPVASFDSAVEGVEDLGEVKSRSVNGVGSGARGKRDPKARARVTVTIGQLSPLVAARNNTFRSSLSSALSTLGYMLAALLWGLIVLVPIFLALALVLKLARRILRPGKKLKPARATVAVNEAGKS